MFSADSATRLSAWVAPVYTVHSGPGRPRRRRWTILDGVSFHAFADDTQLYVHCRRDDVMSAVRRLENCIDDVSHWMSANRLKLNADKTPTALGRVTPWSGCAGERGSVLAAQNRDGHGE